MKSEQERTTAVDQGIKELLAANNCRLEPRVILTHGNVKGELVILPNPEINSNVIPTTTDTSSVATPEATPENPAPVEGEAVSEVTPSEEAPVV